MKDISSKFLQKIHQKAGRLEERFGIELSNGIVPKGLDLRQIVNWNSYMSSPGGSSLALRNSWFVEDAELLMHTSQNHDAENEKLTGWIAHFKEILTAFYNRGGQAFFPPFIQKNEPVPFEELLIPWVEYATSHAFQNSDLFSLQAQQQLARDLLKDLSRLSSACFLEAFNSFQQKPELAPTKKYQQFITEMYAGGAFAFWEAYAALARILVDAMEHWKKGTTLLIERLTKDYHAIANHFFGREKIGLVANVQSNLGSRHTADGQVHIIHFEGNQRIVYRPRAARTDQALEQILTWINTLGASFNLQAASTLNHDTYSWQAYIPYSPCTNKVEVEAFYRRQGQLSGLLFALGSTDYHFGNIRACGAFPILIDNETLFSPILQRNNNTSISGDPFLDNSIKDSLAHSHLLMDTVRLFFPNAPSIIGVMEQEEHYPIDRLLPVNKDNMAIDKAKMVRKGQNFAKLNRQTTDPYRFIPSIKEGYSEMMALIQENVHLFHEKVKEATDNFQLEIRLLVRSSIYYHKILTQSLVPDLCKNGIDRSIYFECIAAFYLNFNSKPEAKLLLKTEKTFLENHLIPWFHIRMDQDHYVNHLSKNSDVSIFQKSAKVLFEHRLDQIQHHASIERNKKLLDHYYPVNVVKGKEQWGKEEIISNLYFCYAQFFSPPSIQPTSNSVKNYFLEKGTIGLVLLFAAWYRVNGNPLFKSLSIRLLEPLKDVVGSGLHIQENLPIGAMEGLGSIVNTLCLISIYLDEKEPLELAEQVFKIAESIKTDDHSFETGLSGLLFAGLRLSLLTGSTGNDDFLSNRLTEMIAKAISKPDKDPGFGRGVAGILFSGCLLTNYLKTNANKKEIKKLSIQLRKRIRKTWNAGPLSFQNGLAGWVFADVACQQLGMDSLLPVSKKKTIKHLSQLNHEEPDSYSLGVAGRFEALMLLELKEARNLFTWKESWNEKIQVQRKYQLSPKYLNPFFCHGMAGILYQQLRMEHPKVLLPVWGPLF